MEKKKVSQPELIRLYGLFSIIIPYSGKHNYFNIVIHLDDLCDRGTAWRTWENIEFLDITVPTEDYPPELAWGDFRGTWGNIQELVS